MSSSASASQLDHENDDLEFAELMSELTAVAGEGGLESLAQEQARVVQDEVDAAAGWADMKREFARAEAQAQMSLQMNANTAHLQYGQSASNFSLGQGGAHMPPRGPPPGRVTSLEALEGGAGSSPPAPPGMSGRGPPGMPPLPFPSTQGAPTGGNTSPPPPGFGPPMPPHHPPPPHAPMHPMGAPPPPPPPPHGHGHHGSIPPGGAMMHPLGMIVPPLGAPLPRPMMPDVRQYPRGQLMSQFDVRYVSTSQMRALETKDPYQEDYYYHSLVRKREEKKRSEAAGLPGIVELPPLALPQWSETKEMAMKAAAEYKQDVTKRIKNWESENKVLGSTGKSDASRPKALLAISMIQGAEGQEEGESGLRSDLWLARKCIVQAQDALLGVQELRHLMALPGLPPPRRGELVHQVEQVITGLSKSFGVDIVGDASDTASLEKRMNLYMLSKVLEMPRGHRALSRSIPLLRPEQRWALAPSIIAIIFARPPAPSSPALAAEEQLTQSLQMLVGEQKATAPGQMQVPPPPLSGLTRTLELVLAAHRGRPGSLATALGNRWRAELMQAVLKRGMAMASASPPDEIVKQWNTLQAECMQLVAVQG
jgi:hypothetical protein